MFRTMETQLARTANAVLRFAIPPDGKIGRHVSGRAVPGG